MFGPAEGDVWIAPSILSADMCALGEEVRTALGSGADLVHIDVMDGHFVPNISIGLPVLSSLRKTFPDAVLDVHLMISDPERYAPIFARAGASMVTVHAEATPHLDRVLTSIKEEGAGCGVVLNPSTPVRAISEVLGTADMVLLMSVNPGFGGQSFIGRSLGRIEELSSTIRDNGSGARIEVDGGVTADNAEAIVRAGADILVAGSAVFSENGRDIKGNIARLRGSAMRGLSRRAR